LCDVEACAGDGGEEVVPLEGVEARVNGGGNGGCAGDVVEERYLAEVVVFLRGGVVAVGVDVELAFGDDVEAVAGSPARMTSSPAETETGVRVAARRSLAAIESGANIGTRSIRSSSAAGAVSSISSSRRWWRG
jgi:hypothetical protein